LGLETLDHPGTLIINVLFRNRIFVTRVLITKHSVHSIINARSHLMTGIIRLFDFFKRRNNRDCPLNFRISARSVIARDAWKSDTFFSKLKPRIFESRNISYLYVYSKTDLSDLAVFWKLYQTTTSFKTPVDTRSFILFHNRRLMFSFDRNATINTENKGSTMI